MNQFYDTFIMPLHPFCRKMAIVHFPYYQESGYYLNIYILLSIQDRNSYRFGMT